MSIKTWWNRLFNPPEPLTIYSIEPSSAQSRRDDHPFEKHKVRSLIAHGVTMKGDLESDVGMVIDGVVKGSVSVTGQGAALIVRSGGRVEGPVSGPIIVIRGTVIGDVQGHFVRLYPGARVEGMIAAERLQIDDGAEMNSSRIGAGQWVGAGLQHLPSVEDTPALPTPESGATSLQANVPEEDTGHPISAHPAHPLGWNVDAFIAAAKRSQEREVPDVSIERPKATKPKVSRRNQTARTSRAPPQHWGSPVVESTPTPALDGAANIQWMRSPPKRRKSINGQSVPLAVASG